MGSEEKILTALGQINDRLTKLEAGQARLETGQTKLDERLTKLEAGQARLEQKVADMDNVLTRTAVTQEQVVIPQLKLLHEQQEAIMEKLIPVSRIEAIEEDVSTLKYSFRLMNEKLEALQKAQ